MMRTIMTTIMMMTRRKAEPTASGLASVGYLHLSIRWRSTIRLSAESRNWIEPSRCSGRAEKNNPLHIGEPGVGKTALVYGLAKLINENQVPKRLKGARIYGMDMGQMLAGAQYRGDFEKRIKMVMEGAVKEGNTIIYT